MQIKPVTKQHLPEYAEVIRQSFATVAQDFGFTRENCPNHTSFVTDETLRRKIKPGYYPYACFADGKIIAFVALTDIGGGVFELSDLAVLPAHRHLKCGKALLDYCKEEVARRGGSKIELSIIDDNTRVKDWYTAHGFVHTDTKRYASVPFLVGHMEWVEKSNYPIPLGVYRHYKGNHYEVLGFARHSETLEDMVIYKALYGERATWVRPLSMWDNPIEVNGETVKRFEYIGDTPAQS